MKKVFALLSTVMVALVGLSLLSNSAVSAANDKWTVDPTLAEDEIAIYIMNSIMTTFPNYYDNAEKADSNWQGAARMYPWNETRLRVAQLDADGNPTGKYYAVYFSGLTSAEGSGAGNNVLFYDVEDGKPVLRRMDGGGGEYKKTNGAYVEAPMDPSLSHMRKNNSDQDISISYATTSGEMRKTVERLISRGIIFDASGQAIWGIGSSGYDEAGPLVGLGQEFCYVDGVATKVAPGITCDYQMVQAEDENGPIFDEDNNPVMIPTDKIAYVYERFIWKWSETALPTNESAYLKEGWDAAKWDLAWEQDGGYMHVAFTSAAGNFFGLTPDQLEAYNKTLEARGDAPVTTYLRDAVGTLDIPAGGFTYDFGYLDAGTAAIASYNDMLASAYRYGRVENYGKQKTYKFSSKPLSGLDIVKNNNSYAFLEGQSVIEVMANDQFLPYLNVSYEGMAITWLVDDDLTSFSKDLNTLEYYIKLNGMTVVMPSAYTTFDEMLEDFIADYNAYLAEKESTGLDLSIEMFQGVTQENRGEKCGVWHSKGGSQWNWLSTSGNAGVFFNHSVYGPKWEWLLDHMAQNTEHATAKYAKDGNGLRYIPSPGTFSVELFGFLAQVDDSGTSGIAWGTTNWATDGKSLSWLPEKTNLEEFKEYKIDTTDSYVDQNYIVEFTVKNTSSGNVSTFTINYIVVDEYTPILKVNKDALIVRPNVSSTGKVTVDAINKYALTTAYNGKYDVNTKEIKGSDITYKVQYSSPTLDFDNPVEGKHQVTATISNQFKSTSKTFYITVIDVTAPRVEVVTGTVYVPYGSQFKATDGILAATDNVNGNLMLDINTYAVDVSSNTVNTTKPGTYKVILQVYDASSNSTKVEYTVVVGEKPASASDLKSQQQEIIDSVEDLLDGLSTGGSSCSMPTAAYFIEFAAAASLLVLVLRKKNN